MKEENIIQKFLAHEVTKLIGIGAFLWGVISQVIIPINNIQLQQAQIRTDISKITSNYEAQNTAINALTTSVSVLKSRVDTLTKK